MWLWTMHAAQCHCSSGQHFDSQLMTGVAYATHVPLTARKDCTFAYVYTIWGCHAAHSGSARTKLWLLSTCAAAASQRSEGDLYTL